MNGLIIYSAGGEPMFISLDAIVRVLRKGKDSYTIHFAKGGYLMEEKDVTLKELEVKSYDGYLAYCAHKESGAVR